MALSSREFARKVLNGAIYGTSQLTDKNWIDEYCVSVILNAFEQKDNDLDHLPTLKDSFLSPSMPSDLGAVRAELESFLSQSSKCALIQNSKLEFPLLVKKSEFSQLEIQLKLKLIEIISLYKRIANINKEISLYTEVQFSRNKGALNSRVNELINQVKSFEASISINDFRLCFALDEIDSEAKLKRTVYKIIKDSMSMSGCTAKSLVNVLDFPKLHSSISTLTSLNYTSVAPRIPSSEIADAEKNLTLGKNYAAGSLSGLPETEAELMANYSLLWRLKDDIIDENKKGSVFSQLNSGGFLQSLAIRFEKAPTKGFEEITNHKELFEKARKVVENKSPNSILDTLAKVERAFYEESLGEDIQREIQEKVAIANFLKSEALLSPFTSDRLLSTYWSFYFCNAIRNFQQQYCNLATSDPYVVIRADNNDSAVLEKKRKMFLNWITLVDAINMIVEV